MTGLASVQLGRLDTALGIAGEADSESKWKQLGELAMSSGKLDVRSADSPELVPDTTKSSQQRLRHHSRCLLPGSDSTAKQAAVPTVGIMSCHSATVIWHLHHQKGAEAASLLVVRSPVALWHRWRSTA